MNRLKSILAALIAAAGLLPPAASSHAQGTAFLYQGRLLDQGNPANGLYDLRFALYNTAAGAGLEAGPVTNAAISLNQGGFTVPVDFGPAAFQGATCWLEVAVSPAGANQFTTLAPRQALTSAPWALQTAAAGNLLGALATAQLSGGIPSAGVFGRLSPTILPAAVVTNRANGLVLAGSFSGDGVGLTNLPANLARLAPAGMQLITAGSFTLGNTFGDSDLPDANPTNTAVSAFYIDTTLVTWSQWQARYCWATNNGYDFVNSGLGKAPNHPVVQLDWFDVVKWCNARSEQVGRPAVYYADPGFTMVYRRGEGVVYPNWSATGFRLPTEAEWEKAAGGGFTGVRFPWGNLIDPNVACYYGATNAIHPQPYDFSPPGFNALAHSITPFAEPYTTPVGTYAPNNYGLYDMAGNAFEWCWDWYGTSYPGGADPHGPATGSERVIRGGTFASYAFWCRIAQRNRYAPAPGADPYLLRIGFRTVLPAGA